MAALPSWTPGEKAELNKKTLVDKEAARLAANKAAAEALKLDVNKAAADALRASLLGDLGKNGAEKVDIDMEGENLGKRKAEEVDEVPVDAPADVVEEVEEDDDEDVEEIVTVADVPIPKQKVTEDSDAEPEDNVRLWEAGWKDRYYEKKFHVDVTKDRAFVRDIVTKYVEGFCWVLKYYYQGVQSWKWFFPYHYSPFAADFDFISELKIEFDVGEPFKPFEQLMGVLPAASRMHIPETFHPLMLEETSPIIDFYPEKFPIDLNGKKYAWQGVALLSFIEEKRLLEAMESKVPCLSEDEIMRNSKGEELLFVGKNHKLFESLCELYGRRSDEESIAIDPVVSGRMTGQAAPDPNVCIPGLRFDSPFQHLGLHDIEENRSISAIYHMPAMTGSFKAKLLPQVSFPQKELTPDDVYWVRLGGKPTRGRGRGGGRGGAAAARFIRHGTGNYASTQDALPYMGGGGYANSYSTYNPQGGQPYNGGAGIYNGGGGPTPSYGSPGYAPQGVVTRSDNGGRYEGSRGYDSRERDSRDSRDTRYDGSRGGYSSRDYRDRDGRDTRDSRDSRDRDSRSKYSGSTSGGDYYRSSGADYRSGSSGTQADYYSSGSKADTNWQAYGSQYTHANAGYGGGGGYVPNTAYASHALPPRPGSSIYGSLYSGGSGDGSTAPGVAPTALAPESWMADLPGVASMLQQQGGYGGPPGVAPYQRPAPVLAWNRNVAAGASSSRGRPPPPSAYGSRGGRGGSSSFKPY